MAIAVKNGLQSRVETGWYYVEAGAPSNVPVTGVTITTGGPLNIAENDDQIVNYTIAPANASNIGVTWSSSNSSVASVASNGVVSANAVGSAVITVTTDDGAYTDNITVNVQAGQGPTQYTLTTNTSGSGTITLNPSGGTYDDGTTVTATAVPGSGYQFDGWSGAASGTNPSVTITLDNNKTITASFSQAPTGSGNTFRYWRFTATGAVNDNHVALDAIDLMDGGTAQNMSPWIRLDPFPESFTKDFGSAITADALRLDIVWTVNRAPSGFILEGSDDNTNWTTILNESGLTASDYNGASTTTTFPFGTPPTQFSLTVNATNGTVNLSPDLSAYNEGSTVQITPSANQGYYFSGWSGDATGTANPLTVTMDANKNITANFAQNPSGSASYRYWRFTATGAVNDTQAALDAVDLMEGSTAQNMSGWIRLDPFPESFTKDFGSAVTADALRLDVVWTVNRAPSGFTLEGSDDNTNWTTILNKSGLTASDYNGANTTTTFPFGGGGSSQSALTSPVTLELPQAPEDLEEPPSYTLYPNPVARSLKIQGSDEPTKIQLRDSQGQIHPVNTLKNGRIDVSTLPAGIYLITIDNQMIRFMKE